MSRRPRSPVPRAAVLVALLVMTPAGCATGSAHSTAALPACAQVLFVGVRGSGESPTAEHALGATLTDFYRRLTTRYPAVHTARYGLPYAAQTTGSGTVTDAGTRLAALVRRRHRQCPDEHLVLAGYSLGAEILGNALQNPDLAASYAAATLLADPRFNPVDRHTAAGTFDSRYHGARPRPGYPTGLADHIRSYCRAHDPICQAGDPARNKAEHGRYAPGQTSQALAFIEQELTLPQQ